MSKKRWYENTAVIILLIFLFFPAGLFLMWKFSKWNKWVKIAITVLVVLIALFCLLSSEDNPGTPSAESTTTPSVETTREINKEVKSIMDAIGLSETEASAVLKDLKSVGAGEIKACQYLSGDVDKSFKASDNDYSYTIVVTNKKTDTIYCGDIALFSANKGGAIDTMDNYRLSSMEIAQFRVSAKTWVEEGLKAPSTAKYPDSMSVTRNKDTVTVSSYVDSQNSFGAMIRSDFIVQMSYASKGSTLIYLEIDGQKLYGSPVTN